jgi:hypothetical protein
MYVQRKITARNHRCNTKATMRSVCTLELQCHCTECCTVGWDGSVGIVSRYRLDGPGIESRWRRDRPSGPPSPMYNGHRVSSPGVQRSGRGVDHPLPSNAEVKERAEIYFSPSVSSWHVIGLHGEFMSPATTEGTYPVKCPIFLSHFNQI